MKVLSIDPSINNVGWALFDSRHKKKKHAWEWGTWTLAGPSLEARALHLCQLIMTEIEEFDFLITEKPAFFSSQVGQVAAHQNYTIDLAAISFFVAGWFHKDHRQHWAIRAIQWKGSVSKLITARHFYKAFGYTPGQEPADITEHAIDATMMLRFWLETWAMVEPRLVQHTSPESIRVLL